MLLCATTIPKLLHLFSVLASLKYESLILCWAI